MPSMRELPAGCDNPRGGLSYHHRIAEAMVGIVAHFATKHDLALLQSIGHRAEAATCGSEIATLKTDVVTLKATSPA